MKAKHILLVLLVLILLIGFACKKTTFVEYRIDRNSCNGCGECIRVCPNDAIYYDQQNKPVIDQSKCTKCGECVAVCPNSAIY